jgi:hypothetical protein
MEWIILFAASWILFFLLRGWVNFRLNVWCALAALVMQLLIDSVSMQKGMYDIVNPVVIILGSSAFFCFGPVFVIGTLLSRYHPLRPRHVIMNVVLLTALYSLQEYLLLARKALVYQDWYFGESIFINLIAIITLSWFSFFVLGKGGLRN